MSEQDFWIHASKQSHKGRNVVISTGLILLAALISGVILMVQGQKKEKDGGTMGYTIGGRVLIGVSLFGFIVLAIILVWVWKSKYHIVQN